MNLALIAARGALDRAEDRRARCELDWDANPDSLEAYAAFQAALAGLKKAAELYWGARRDSKISDGNSPGG